MNNQRKLRVCYFGTYRKNYARNRILIEGLQRTGITVLECHIPLWQNVSDRISAAQGGWLTVKFLRRLIITYTKLIYKYFLTPPHDVIIVGYPGHFDVFIARIFSIIFKRPLVWDVLNSLYLILVERGIHINHPFTVWLIRTIERRASSLPDLLLLDTQIFIDWFKTTHKINTNKFKIVRIGANERIFYPRPLLHKDSSIFKVIYYGSYIPNHGVLFVAQAAKILKQYSQIRFTFIGHGPDLKIVQEYATKHSLSNIQFIDWLEQDDLVLQLAESDLLLGVFGTTIQNKLTNNNKIYEGFAMKKPIITCNTPALPKCIQHREHIYLCECGNPTNIAEGIIELWKNPELMETLANNGFVIFKRNFSASEIGLVFSCYLNEFHINSK